MGNEVMSDEEDDDNQERMRNFLTRRISEVKQERVRPES